MDEGDDGSKLFFPYLAALRIKCNNRLFYSFLEEYQGSGEKETDALAKPIGPALK